MCVIEIMATETIHHLDKEYCGVWTLYNNVVLIIYPGGYFTQLLVVQHMTMPLLQGPF